MLTLAALLALATPPVLPAPYATPSVTKQPVPIGWPEGGKPTAPAGFEVVLFASGLSSPRQLLVLANGNVLAAEARTKPKDGSDPARRSADRITLLRDSDADGKADQSYTLAEGLNQPFGMALVGADLWVANTDGIVKAPYQPGQVRLGGGFTAVLPLPAGGYNNHWTRNLLASADGKTVYVSIGSGSNVGENGVAKEVGRAEIRAIDVSTGKARPYATGLRNPVGMAFAPDTSTLWTAVNERDGLGDDLVPDYITSVAEGDFYGWPWSYYGQMRDPRPKQERPDLVAKALVPDLPVGAHTAALGLAFSAPTMPEGWRDGAFVARHGSWNRSAFAGYDVVFAPFAGGKPTGELKPFLTGFIADETRREVHGRPVSLAVTPAGALLVADDSGGSIWLVRPAVQAPPAVAGPKD